MKKYFLFIISLVTALSLNAQCTDNGNHWNKSWVSCTTSTNPNPARGAAHWLLYEFQEAHYIDASYVWNANRTGESGWGAKEVVIDYSLDGTTWAALGQYTFPQAPEANDYTGFLGPKFNGLFVKKILITILSTHDGGNCASISEIQFKIDQEACFGIIDACGICDGPGAPIWYLDSDSDGLGDVNNTTAACTQPAGYVADSTDMCDNGNLGWAEVAPLFVNNGCTGCHGANGASGLDLRSYATIAGGGNKCGTSLLTGTKLVDIINISGYTSCDQPISVPSMNARVGNSFDAEELAQIQTWINGGAPELCTDYCPNYQTEIPYNGLDDDCDTLTLDDDLDKDGFINAEDCNDNDAAINPNAVDIPNNNIDENCDGIDEVSGVCMDSLMDISTITQPIYHAISQINSTAMISTDTVIFKAGNSIDLLPGFHVEATATFTAQIMDCAMSAAGTFIATNTVLANTNKLTAISLKTSPNPFQENTNIQFDLPVSTVVNLAVYDVNGQLVKKLIQEAFYEEGQHQLTFTNANYAPNIYFLVLQTENAQVMRKLMLIR